MNTLFIIITSSLGILRKRIMIIAFERTITRNPAAIFISFGGVVPTPIILFLSTSHALDKKRIYKSVPANLSECLQTSSNVDLTTLIVQLHGFYSSIFIQTKY